jgi:hypothetical protein
MGIYTSNNYFGGNVPDYAAQIPANEAYDAAFGCAHILADCQANDMALFESTIYSDMNEVMAVQEGYQVVNENAFTDVIKKIIEMFKKLIAKIKGIFKAFIAKLDGLAKNGKDLVKKYEKQILKYSNWKEYKVKIRTPKGNSNDSTSLINTLFAVSSGTKTIKDIDKRYAVKTSDITSTGWDSGLGDSLKTPEKIKNADADDIKEAILKTYIAEAKASVCSDYKDFSENVTDELWDDEETLDGDDDNISSSTFTAPWIKGVLEDKKLITDAEKLNKKLDDNINNIIDRLDKTHTELANLMSKEGTDSYANFDDGSLSFGRASVSKDGSYKSPKDGTKFTKGLKGQLTNDEYDAASDETQKLYDSTPGHHTLKSPNTASAKATEVQKIIVAMQKIASNEQEVVTKVTSEYMAQLKFAVSQARKMWTSAAAYTSTQHKEDASYYQAVGECAAEQAYQKFEAIHS